jgi:DNA-binding CsgD family transcriptional regulator
MAGLLPDRFAALPHDNPLELLRQAPAVLDDLPAGTGTGTAAPAPPPVIVVDDADLLDDVSATFVHYLAVRDLAKVLLAVRSEGLPPDLITVLWKDELIERIELDPLDPVSTTALLETVLDGRLDPISFRRMWQTTGGHPLFLREVVQGALGDGSLRRHHGVWQWDGGLPATGRLMELFRTRLAAEDPRCCRVLELVACGDALPVWLAERLVGRASLEVAERAGFLEWATDTEVATLAFAQPVYREVLLATMPPSRRREACGQLAAALLEHGTGTPSQLVQIAVWQLAAGTPPDQRGISFAAAARLALLDHDPAMAERLARAALDAERPEALAVLAAALEKQGRHGEVVQLLQSVSAEDDPAMLTLAWASNHYWADKSLLGPPPDLPPALADGSDDPSAGEVAAAEAWVLFFEGWLPQCIEEVRRVLGQSTATLRARTWVATIGAAALGLGGHVGEALCVADLGRSAAQRLGPAHPWGPPEIRWARVLALVTAGRVAEARRLLEAGREPAEATAQVLGMERGFDGLVARLQGDFPAAVRGLREAVALMEQADVYQFLRLWLAELAAALAGSDDAHGAREVFDEARTRDNGTNRVFDPWIALDGAWVCAAEGRLSDAAAHAARAADSARDLGQAGFEVVATFDVARLGRPELVDGRLRDLAAAVDGELAPTCRDATTALVRRDGAELLDCSRRFEALGHHLVAAEAANVAHLILRSARAPLGAGRAAERARRLRLRCPEAATPLLDLRSSHLPLTQREREIARLAAAGRSSPDIARLLDISTRTVDNHLGRVYAKLGVRGRDALAALF